MHTSDVETEGADGESPAPGQFVLRRDSDENLAPSRDSAMSIRISDDSMPGATEIDEVAKNKRDSAESVRTTSPDHVRRRFALL
jgi:hypothetical protein